MDWLGDSATWVSGQLGAALFSPMSRDSLYVIGLGWLIGALAWRYSIGRERFTLLGYLRHAFPGRVYLSRSFAIDVQVYLFTRLLLPMRWMAMVASVALTAQFVVMGLTHAFGPVRLESLAASGKVALAVLLFLAYDFGTYVTHRLSHRLPVLWAFHRLHHSAEELNPLTLNRKHPVYTLLSIQIDCLTVAPLQALVIYGFGADTSVAVLALANLGFVAFAYCASSLRHTHIWLSYGAHLERVFVSPALHQIHHSRAPRHLDRNFGEVLSVWDWLFGTLYLPREREDLTFGLADEERQPHPTLSAAMLEPFGYAWRTIRRPAAQDAMAEPVLVSDAVA